MRTKWKIVSIDKDKNWITEERIYTPTNTLLAPITERRHIIRYAKFKLILSEARREICLYDVALYKGKKKLCGETHMFSPTLEDAKQQAIWSIENIIQEQQYHWSDIECQFDGLKASINTSKGDNKL